MTSRIFAAALVAILFAGAIETPAHSQTNAVERAGMMVVMATVCDHAVPDDVFMPELVAVAVENETDVTTARNLVRAQAQLFARRLLDNDTVASFCAETQRIKF